MGVAGSRSGLPSVAAWLEGIGLGGYAAAFAVADVDAEALPDLTEADLAQLGVTLGHRKKLLRAIAAFGAISASAAGPERRQVCILFCDLVGSTALAARLDPEDLREVMQAYQQCCADAVARFGGTVAHVLGDGVMVRFGYPLAHEDDPERAACCGLDLVACVAALHPRPGVALQARVGIATGLVVVGDTIHGTGEPATVGDTPNLAARLQTVAAPGQVVVDALTCRLLGAGFDCLPLGSHPLKGFEAPVPVSAVRGVRPGDTRFAVRQSGAPLELVGRGPELARLLAAWELAERGEGQVVLLSGEPGIGKSRLLADLCIRLQARPHALVQWQCAPHRTGTALYPAIEWLTRAAGFQPADTVAGRLEKLEQVLGSAEATPLFADLLSLPAGERYAGDRMSPVERRRRTLRALLLWFNRMGLAQPVCFVVEDAHWIDPTTLELLGLALTRIPRRAAMLVVTHRPEFVPPWPDAPARPWLRRETLARLERPEAARVVALTAGTALPADLLGRILDRADGVPLFLEELTRATLESAAAPGAEEAIPSSLHASLNARLDRLASVKEVAQVASVIGREFGQDLLAAVSGHPAPVLRPLLDQLAAADIVQRRGQGWAFRHALIQDAAYAGLLRGRRRELHGRVAAAIERDFPERCAAEPEVLAHHFTEAGLPAAGIGYWLQAAQRALVRSANREAIAHTGRGLELVDQIADPEERARSERALLNMRLFPAITVFGWSSAEVEAVYRRLLAANREGGPRRELFLTLYGEFAMRIVRAETEEAARLAGLMVAAAEDTGSAELLHHGLRCRVAASFFRARLPEMRRDLAAAARISAAGGDWVEVDRAGAAPRVAEQLFTACALWVEGAPLQASAALHDALSGAEATGRVNVMAFAHQLACILALLAGDLPRLERYAGRLAALGVEHGLQFDESSARAYQAVVRMAAAPAEGAAALAAVLARLDAMRATSARPHLLCALARARATAGGLAAGLPVLDEAERRVQVSGERIWASQVLRTRARLLGRGGHVAAAEAAGRAALELARAQDAPGLELKAALTLSHVLLHAGRAAEIPPVLAPALRGMRDGAELPEQRRAAALLAGCDPAHTPESPAGLSLPLPV